MSEPMTIDEAVGDYLRTFRTERGVSLTQVADAAKRYGADWGSAGVRRMERGEAALTLDKLIQLALALRYISAEPLTLDALLGQAETIGFGSKQGTELVAPRDWFTSILHGGQIAPPVRNDEVAFHPGTGTFMQGYSGPEMLPGNLAEAGYEIVTPTRAEERVAAKLGIHEMNVSTAARALWKRSLDDEARLRAGADASPQARGRVTRILTEELRTKIEEMRGRNSG